ncbi:MAG: hypothetical protein AMS15_02815 [Planctomycetes bacterium DG_23]|nr:MAG: hypothetical protein AMS15_02815 [Planctomycetes bacterium DG_23]
MDKEGAKSILGFLDKLPRVFAPWKPSLVNFVGNYLLADRFKALIYLCGFLLVMVFLRGLCDFAQRYFTGYVTTRSIMDIRNDLYGNLIALPLGFYTDTGVGRAMGRFTEDVSHISRGMRAVFTNALKEPLNLLVAISVVFYINWKLAVVSFITLPLVGFLIRNLGRKIRVRSRKALTSWSKLVSILQETFAGIRVIKAFSMEPRERGRFQDENRNFFHQNMRIVKADAIVSPVTEFLTLIGVIMCILLGGYYVINAGMPTEQFFTFYIALALALDALKKLSRLPPRLQESIAGAERVFKFMDERAEVMEVPGATALEPLKSSIRFVGVSFDYDRGEKVLEDVNLEVNRAEMVALVGLSGAGKTTLVNLIPRFYHPTSGHIEIDGQDTSKVTLSSLRRQIGIVTQEVILFNDSVANNIAYGKPDATRAEIVRAARSANADDFIQELPQGYDTVIGERGATLSGGERQRLALARAIVKDPAILILDEATSELDSESEHLIQEALSRFVRGRTTIIIAHRLSTVTRADRILVLDEGRIQATGTHKELLNTSPLYRRLYETQFSLALES